MSVWTDNGVAWTLGIVAMMTAPVTARSPNENIFAPIGIGLLTGATIVYLYDQANPRVERPTPRAR